jgi:hypothetical protein
MEPLPPPDLVDAGASIASSIVEMPAAAVAAAPPMLTASIFDVNALLTHWNMLLIVAVWAGIQSVKRAMPDEWFDAGKPLARLLPLAPIAVCSVAVWIPGPWLDPSETAAQKLILGVILGTVTSNFHTIASRLGLHSIIGIEADTRKLKKAKAKPEEPKPEAPREAPAP